MNTGGWEEVAVSQGPLSLVLQGLRMEVPSNSKQLYEPTGADELRKGDLKFSGFSDI